MDHVIQLPDREQFVRCRRAWDFGSPLRRNLEPVPPEEPPDLAAGLRAALAAYYFPAMWAWDRSLVHPIVLQTFTKTMEGAEPAVIAAGAQLLDAYRGWAPEVDDFTPVRTTDELSVVVGAPGRPGEGLLAADGGGIHLHATADLVATDEHDRLWIVEHRFVEPRSPWADPDLLALDSRAGTLCWVAEEAYVARVAGVLFNEVRLAGPAPAGPGFRRTRVRKQPRELRQLRRQAATELVAMLDPAVVLYPTPTPANCSACPFRRPCLAMSAGEDVEPVLAAGYRTKVPFTIPLPERTGSLGPQRVIGWKTAGPGPSSLDDIPSR